MKTRFVLFYLLSMLYALSASDWSAYWISKDRIVLSSALHQCEGKVWLIAGEDSYLSDAELKKRVHLGLAWEMSSKSALDPGSYGKLLDSHYSYGFVQRISQEELLQLIKRPLQITRGKGEKGCSTRVQALDVLDEFAVGQDTRMGARYFKDRIEVWLWSPVARDVKLLLKNQDAQESLKMKPQKEHPGVWILELSKDDYKKQYRFELELFYPKENRVLALQTTDPYALSLSEDGEWSALLDPLDPLTVPNDWRSVKPRRTALGQSTIYELHVRDFSLYDPMVARQNQGKFQAFCSYGSYGMRHLAKLSKAGLTHVHLLPVFDFASVPALQEQTRHYPLEWTKLENLKELQKRVSKIKSEDQFNWGYDPRHYAALEESYLVNQDPVSRIREFRQMVTCLDKLGLGVIMDVVYNHTHSSGLYKDSFLDKLAPHYYYRVDRKLDVSHSTCCPDTESQRKMMEHLMIQTLVDLAVHYKLSGFRFDLMGHHSTSNFKRLKKALSSHPGIKEIPMMYGEGWSFGSLKERSPAGHMSQANASKVGIGSFNDRIRDSVRGGNFMHSSLLEQGWGNGLHDLFNHKVPKWKNDKEREKVFLNLADLTRHSMTGNLVSQKTPTSSGLIDGNDLRYFGARGAGFAVSPDHVVQYASAHDNYTLWDHIQAKAQHLRTKTRVRMQLVSLGAILFSRGGAFLHAGSEILRSKSGDGDSYDSGDLFNRLDYSLESENWGIGLPIEEKNRGEWKWWKEVLNLPSLRSSKEDREFALSSTLKLLKIRNESSFLGSRYETEPDFPWSEEQAGSGFIAIRYSSNNESETYLLNPLSKDLILRGDISNELAGVLDQSDCSYKNGHLIVKAMSLCVSKELLKF